jgi:hypothetical protein
MVNSTLGWGGLCLSEIPVPSPSGKCSNDAGEVAGLLPETSRDDRRDSLQDLTRTGKRTANMG